MDTLTPAEKQTADAPVLSGLLRVRPAVLDTGPLTTDVIGSVKRGEPSPLWLAMQAGLVRGYAAHHVWAEVPRVLAKRAGQARLPFQELERLWWDEYVPLIRVVDCVGLPTTRQSQILAGRDDSDTNTLLLAGASAAISAASAVLQRLRYRTRR